MTHGITPIDAAFEMLGLYQSQTLVRFIFIETLTGKLVFALGFILSVHAGLEKACFKPIFVFLLMFFSAWLLLILPQTKSSCGSSAMERAGYKAVTTAQILEKQGIQELKINPLLGAFSQWVDGGVRGVVGAVDLLSHGHSYAQSPFLLTQASLAARLIASQGITDPVLEEKAVRFYQDEFLPVLQKLRPGPESLWPGHARVLAYYREEARRQWEVLRDEMYTLTNQDKLMDQIFEHFYGARIDKDAVVSFLWKHELAAKSERYVLMAYDPRRDVRPAGGMAVWDIWATRMMASLPFIQGGALVLVYSTLPLMLIWMFLSRRITPLVIFLVSLLGVKSWTLFWCLIDRIFTGCLTIGLPWADGMIGLSSAGCAAAALCAIMVPVLVTTGIGVVVLKTEANG